LPALGLTGASLGPVARIGEATVDPAPLGVDHLLQLFLDLFQHVVELEAVELLLALLAQPLEELLEPHHAVAGAILGAVLHEPLQRGAQIAIGQQVVRELLDQLVWIERRDLLRTVPAGIAVCAHGTLPAKAAGPNGREAGQSRGGASPLAHWARLRPR